MKRIHLIIALFFCYTMITAAQINQRERISLNGTWQFSLDPQRTLKATDNFTETVALPGTTDTNRKGNALTKKDETTHLSRLYSYEGLAWYRREIVIPDGWKKKTIRLHLERTKPSTLYVDGERITSLDNISTPQVYTLPALKPGKHQLALAVDNSQQAVPPQIVSNSHAYTEDTQTNWNGIIGNIYLEALNALTINEFSIETKADQHEVSVTLGVDGLVKKNTEVRFILVPWGSDIGYIIARKILTKDKTNQHRMRITYRNDTLALWSEFHPQLYRMRIEVANNDEAEKPFGIRTFTAKGTQFYINDHLTFLRGKHDACVFPLKAHVPMEVSEWRRYLQICKGYGINHIRFHSWCPPEACFVAADIEGVYLQPELPFWGDFNKDDHKLMNFLIKEGINILNTYGHHPSFVMFALGNELWGDIPTMKSFSDTFRKMQPTRLYTFGSNYYLGYQGWKEGMDYFTTCRVGGEKWGKFNTHTRGSFSFADTFDGGYLNSTYPNSRMDFAEAIAKCPVPVISHETAQFQTYPDYSEISKYRGVLYPYNMEVFRSRLEQAGMGDQAADFHKASGAWSLRLYKADIEMDLRTKGFGGFQLLDLQDYPGQGSAYVGILDAFMETKGLTTPQEFRQWCSPVVPLAIMDKFCWKANEPFKAEIKLAQYTEQPLANACLNWQLGDQSGSIAIASDSVGLFSVGHLQLDFSQYDKPTRLNLTLSVENSPYKNTYPVWIYPANVETETIGKGIVVAHALTAEVEKRLQAGAKVLFMPDTTQLRSLTVGGLFQTDYWNYRMFKTISEKNKRPVSPGTLGILTRPEHPLFREFPTDAHTNWQWFPMIKDSRPFMLDNTAASYRPIVQVIDNIERNHKLGLIFEFSVGKGRLLVCMTPLDSLQQFPEAKQLYRSVLAYMQSSDFQPTTHITVSDLRKLLTTEVTEGQIGKLDNISPY